MSWNRPNADTLKSLGVDSSMVDRLIPLLEKAPSEAAAWDSVSQMISGSLKFEVQERLFNTIYAEWNADEQGPPPAFIPWQKEIQSTNIYKWMDRLGIENYSDFHRWTCDNREDFWTQVIDELEIPFKKKYEKIVEFPEGIEFPRWLKGSKINIADACFSRCDAGDPAIVYQADGKPGKRVSYGELEKLTNRVANSLVKAGFKPGDAIAIDMLMTYECVAIYLGIVKAGCAAVSIADSFSPTEIATRNRIAQSKGIFTQDFIVRGDKKLPMYQKVIDSKAPRAIVLPKHEDDELEMDLREGDISWKDFLVESDEFQSVECEPNDPVNILFSSGTTGDPKAIPWSHTTPIKAAMDGFFHHDIQYRDVVAWPTSIGWMMGPWLIFATLMNKGTMALFYGAPIGREFGKFVQAAGVKMLGLVPSLVKAWRATDAIGGLDWSQIKVFSSTGECSNASDYLFLMSLAGYRPIIEYCGGTEIGGGYITGTLVQPASPSTFSTPAIGLDLYLLDGEGKEAKEGEVFLVPPSMGLSNELLNRDHHEVYFANSPKGPKGETLRRHGDEIHSLGKGYYSAHGRTDDTMNLGGIKVSSVEIERTVNQLSSVSETAAIAVNPKGGGPSELHIFTVLESGAKVSEDDLKTEMQKLIKTDLNPLFKLSAAHVVDLLPRTASNKVMRRVLRAKIEG